MQETINLVSSIVGCASVGLLLIWICMDKQPPTA